MPQGEVAGSEAVEGERSKTESPPIWNEYFDPLTFVSENLKGYSSRLDAMSLEELRKLAAGTGLKCLALNQMVFNRQEKEASDKLERELGAAKEELERDLADQLAKSQADFQKSLDKEKKKVSTLRRSKRDLTIDRNAMIVALAKIWQDAKKRDDDISQLQSAADRLHGDVKELEEENDSLKEQMAGKYVDGFNAAMEQVRVLFPDLDGDILAEIDFVKKVEDGKLVSRFPA
jgi:chromosome segregation ATPase